MVSRGVSRDTPRKVRDSVEIQATSPQRAWDHPLPHASKTSGQKVALSDLGGSVRKSGSSRDETEKSQGSAIPETPREPKRPRDDDRRKQGVRARSRCHPGPGCAAGEGVQVFRQRRNRQCCGWHCGEVPCRHHHNRRERMVAPPVKDRTCHLPSRDPKQACGGGAARQPEKEAKGCACRWRLERPSARHQLQEPGKHRSVVGRTWGGRGHALNGTRTGPQSWDRDI